MRFTKTFDIPKLIIFSGVDGSGKSTYIEKLKDEFVSLGFSVSTVWFRMNYLFTRPVLLFCRLTGLTHRIKVKNQFISIHKFYKSRIISKIVQYLHFFDTLLKYFFVIFLPIKLKNKFILCDRFVYDILIDFAVESKEQDIFNKRIARLFRLLLPKNSISFLIFTEKNLILKRRPDVIEFDPEFETRYNIYKSLMKEGDFIVINNNNTIEENLDIIKKKIGISNNEI